MVHPASRVQGWRGVAPVFLGHAVLLAALESGLLLLLTHNVSAEPYLYDEADYMYAASLGFFANYTDTPSISFADFLRAGWTRSGQHSQRQALSGLIRGANDVLFYRHWHGPLYHYLLIPVSRLGLNERGVRSAMFAIPAASLAVLYLGCLWLVPGPAGIVAAILTSALFLSSHAVVWSTELAPHQLFALCSLASLVFLLKAITARRRAYWYLSVVMVAMAFCTLEIAIVLAATLAVCAVRERCGWRFAGASLALFCATVFALWPAAILKLSFLKAYGVMAYLALFRESPWGSAGFLETWRMRFLDSPVEWAVVLAGLVLYFRTGRPRIYPLALFALLLMAATLRVLTSTPRYSLPWMPALDFLAGLALYPAIGRLRRPASFAVVALALVVLYGTACFQVVSHPHKPSPRHAAVLSYIHQKKLENKALLVPQEDLPTLHYYLPGARLRGYYGQMPASSQDFHPDAILYPGDPPRLE